MAIAELIARMDLDIAQFQSASKAAEKNIDAIDQAVRRLSPSMANLSGNVNQAFTSLSDKFSTLSQRFGTTSPILDQFGRGIKSSGEFARKAAPDFVRWGDSFGHAAVHVTESLGPVGQRSESVATSLHRFTHAGLADMLAQVPILGGALSRLATTFAILTGPIGIAVAAGALFINKLRDMQEQASATLVAVTNLSEGIGTKFASTQIQVGGIRARAQGSTLGGAVADVTSAALEADAERERKIRDAIEERDKVERKLFGSETERNAARILAQAKIADATVDAENKKTLAAARANAELIQFERDQQAAALQTAQIKRDTTLQVRSIEAAAAHDRITEINTELERSVTAANAERSQKIQALGPAVGPGDERVIQANAEAESKITIAKAQATAQRRKLEEDLAGAEIALRHEVVAATLAANAEIIQAAHERAQAELAAQAEARSAANQRVETQLSVGGDTVGAARQAVTIVVQAQHDEIAAFREAQAQRLDGYRADLSSFRQSEAAKVEDFNRSLDLQYGKTVEIQARIEQARDSGKDEEANQLQATLDRVTALRVSKAQESGNAVTAREQSTADRIDGIQSQLSAKEAATQDRIVAANLEGQDRILQAEEARATKSIEQANRIADAEQTVTDARAKTITESIDGEAKVLAARLSAAGDAKGAEEVLGRARVESIQVAEQAEVKRHQTTIANLQRELEIQQEIAANDPNAERQAEAQIRVAEITAQIQAEEQAVLQTRIKSESEIDAINAGLGQSKQAVRDIGAETAALNASFAKIASASATLVSAEQTGFATIDQLIKAKAAAAGQADQQFNAVKQELEALDIQRKAAIEQDRQGLLALQQQLNAINTGKTGSFGFVQDPKLRAEIERARTAIVNSSGQARIDAKAQLDALLAANQEQLDADQAAAQIQQERSDLDQKRNDLLAQIQSEQSKAIDDQKAFEERKAALLAQEDQIRNDAIRQQQDYTRQIRDALLSINSAMIAFGQAAQAAAAGGVGSRPAAAVSGGFVGSSSQPSSSSAVSSGPAESVDVNVPQFAPVSSGSIDQGSRLGGIVRAQTGGMVPGSAGQARIDDLRAYLHKHHLSAAMSAAYIQNHWQSVVHAQTGFLVPGSGSGDIVPAMLEPGELVVPRDLTRSLLQVMGRSTPTSRYQSGGIVRPTVNETGSDQGRRRPTSDRRLDPLVVQLVVDRKILAQTVVPESRREGRRGTL